MTALRIAVGNKQPARSWKKVRERDFPQSPKVPGKEYEFQGQSPKSPWMGLPKSQNTKKELWPSPKRPLKRLPEVPKSLEKNIDYNFEDEVPKSLGTGL